MERIRSWAAKHRDAVLVGSVGAVLVGAGLWAGIPAARSAGALAAQQRTLRELVARVEARQAAFRPAAPEESAQWRIARARAQALGVPASQNITSAQTIARLGEDVGFTGVRVRFIPSDSTSFVLPPVVQVGGARFEPAGYAFGVTATGSYEMLVQFVRALPPSVAVRTIASRRVKDAVVHELVLAVIESVETSDAGQAAVRMGSDDVARGAGRGVVGSPGG